jgi:hypothetical protein
LIEGIAWQNRKDESKWPTTNGFFQATSGLPTIRPQSREQENNHAFARLVEAWCGPL